jgi:hypothetical protein
MAGERKAVNGKPLPRLLQMRASEGGMPPAASEYSLRYAETWPWI